MIINLSRFVKRLMAFGVIAGGCIAVGNIWTDCNYCENLTSPVQLCNGTGTSTCGLFYMQGRKICCSNHVGTNCSNYTNLGTMNFSYQLTSGNSCTGTYKCSGSSSSNCDGDMIIAASSNCVPYGPIISYSDHAYACNN